MLLVIVEYLVKVIGEPRAAHDEHVVIIVIIQPELGCNLGVEIVELARTHRWRSRGLGTRRWRRWRRLRHSRRRRGARRCCGSDGCGAEGCSGPWQGR